MRCRSVLGLMVSLLVGVGACVDEQFLQVAPRIKVDVCEAAAGTEECLVDFGTVALSSRVTKEVEISNPSSIDLMIVEPTFAAGGDPAFRVEHWPDRIAAGLRSKMVVSYRPLTENATTATLMIHSNAANMDKEPVRIQLKGVGTDQGLPQLEIVARAPCRGSYPGTTEVADLGITGVGYTVTCTFEIFNHGAKDLVVEEIVFIPAETDPGFAFSGRVPGVDPETGERFESTIPPPVDGNSSSRSFVIQATPTGIGTFQGVAVVLTNDPGCEAPETDGSCAPENSHERVRIPVQVEGAHTPTAVARILSVNGESYHQDMRIEPLDDVVLTAEDSWASSRNLRVVEYRWEIINQPPGSHGFLDDRGAVSPRFMFDNSRNTIPGVDIAGFWAVRLTVVDSRGAASVNEALIAFNAIPTDAIHVQLVWDHPDSDVDLHLVHDLGGDVYEEFSDNDCYYMNCKVESGGLSWFADEAANPTLDVDDLYGYGPENINIEAPATGRYKAAVHYYSDHGEGDTVAIIRLFLFGNLHSEYHAELTNRDWWEVAIIDWPSREVTVINTIEADGD